MLEDIWLREEALNHAFHGEESGTATSRFYKKLFPFLEEWKKLGASREVLNWIQEGVKLEWDPKTTAEREKYLRKI